MNISQRALLAYHEASGAEPVAARTAAARLLEQHGLPAPRDEYWRNANLRALDAVRHFLTPAAAVAPAPPLPAPLPGFERIVCIDGRRSMSLSDTAALARLQPQLTLSSVEATPTDADQRFTHLNSLFGVDAAVLRVAGVAAIEILYVGSGADGSSYPRLEVELAPGAQLRLVERHLGSAGGGLICTQLRLQLQPGARLAHYRLQACAAATLWIDTLVARLSADAEYRVCQISAGAGTARSSSFVQLAGENARLSWNGLAAVDGEQVNDCLLRVEHAAPRTRAEQCFRGISGGRASIGCDTDVRVAAAARGSQVTQSLRGLIEGAGAAIHLRPRLTIHTDDIKAAHGATTGQLDEQLLFYLLSRGLEADSARALLKWAFLGDVLRTIDIPELRQQAESAAAGHLSGHLPFEAQS
jgi:Fe-S cluster assembly protein SufD